MTSLEIKDFSNSLQRFTSTEYDEFPHQKDSLAFNASRLKHDKMFTNTILLVGLLAR